MNFFDVIVREARLAGSSALFVEQRDRPQTGMAFVHVEPLQTFVAQRVDHVLTAHTEDDFLAESVLCIAAVKPMHQVHVITRQPGPETNNPTGTIGDHFTTLADHKESSKWWPFSRDRLPPCSCGPFGIHN